MEAPCEGDLGVRTAGDTRSLIQAGRFGPSDRVWQSALTQRTLVRLMRCGVPANLSTMNQPLIFFSLAIAVSIGGFSNSADAAARKFFKPTLLGDTLAACSGASSGCGKPVADHYCRSKGYAPALNYRLNRSDGGGAQARTIDNELVTISASSPTFVFVKCFTSETLDRQ